MTQSWVDDYRNALGYTPDHTPLVPATFISCFRDSEFCAFASLDLQLSQLLHAGQQYKFYGELAPGDWVTSQTEVTRCLTKNGKTGSMVFMEFKNEFRKTKPNGGDTANWKICDLIAESVMTVIVKDTE